MPHPKSPSLKTAHDSGENESALRLKAAESAWLGKKIEGEMLGTGQARRPAANKKRFQPRGRRRLEPPVVTPKTLLATEVRLRERYTALQAPPSYWLAVTPR